MPTSRRIEIGFFFVLATIVALLTFFILKPYLSGLFLAVVFTIVFRPFYQAILRRVGDHPVLSAMLTVFALVLVIVVPLFFFGFFIFRDAQDFYRGISEGGLDQGMIQTGTDYIQNLVRPLFPGFSLDLISYLKQGFGLIVQNLGSLFGKVFTAVLELFLMLLGVFYFLRDGKKFREHLIFLSPLSDTYDRSILNRFEVAVNSVVKGALSIALIQGVLSGIGFALFGVPSPMLWGAVAAITALIPGIGTALVIAPVVVYLFFFGSMTSAVGLLIWGVLAVGLIDNLLAPILIERDLKIHPFLILLSVLGGLAHFGPIGFLAGPVTLALLFALFDIFPLLLHPSSS
ncbi:MAG: AI-2E family transporter [bacterium]|nr:AI-2E family transporter [bacterium]